MELLSMIVNATLLLVVGGLITWQMNGRFNVLERRMDRLEGSIDALRSDLTQVALALGARPPAPSSG